MTDSESTNLSKRVIVTEDGVVRYYWWEWVPALFWAILGLGLIPILVFFLLPPLYLLLYFLLPGLGVLYFAIGKAFNYTEFRVESGNLFVHHKPLPWRGNISIPTMEIGNIDVKKIDTIHYDSNDFGSTVTHSVKYQVAAIRQDRQLPLISVRSLDIADAIAQEVGTALGKSRRINTKNRISALRESLSNDETKLIQKTVLDPSTPYFLLLVFLTGVFFTYAGVNNIREWRASQSWPSVTGRVVEPQIVEVRDESDGNVSFSYTLKITYQYSVNDKIYTSDRISFVGRPSYISENLAQQALRNMSPDGRVNVYYNPADPNRAVLDHQTFYNSYNTELVIGITFLVMSTIGALILIWYRKRFANKIRKKPLRVDLPSCLGNRQILMQEKFGKDLIPHRVKYRMLKR